MARSTRTLLLLSILLLYGLLLPVLGQDGTWTRTTANDDLVKALEEQGLSRAQAEARAKEIIKERQRALEDGHPGLADGNYSYDCYQDIPIGPDGEPQNCFGDVARRPARWEPTDEELSAWLKEQGYAPSDCECECGKQKVAVYTLTLVVTPAPGQADIELKIPVHIAEEQEDCTWKSRMGNLGVMTHQRPQQLWSTQRQADTLGRALAADAEVALVRARLSMQCHAKAHERKDYHGRPGGPLECDRD